mgnify:CR=1 FL=1
MTHCSPKENLTCNVCDIRLELLEFTQIWRDKFVYVSSTIHELTRSDFDGWMLGHIKKDMEKNRDRRGKNEILPFFLPL